MDPMTLIGQSSPLGYPAPYWFLVMFKVLGFILHMVPMHLWFAGILIAMHFRMSKHEYARTLSNRLMKQMPIIIALGVNFGIVPLLFMQVAYHKAFYPATILMAWYWLAIVLLLTVAYYGIYIYAAALKNGAGKMTRISLVSGWVSSVLFLAIGFIFSNGFSLMANIGAWPKLWESTSVAGAPLGIGLNLADHSLLPRYLMMFGLALLTTATYIAFDSAFFARKESTAYRKWAPAFAFRLYTVGIIWFVLTGSWYVFGTWPGNVRSAMFAMPTGILTIITAIGPGSVWLLLMLKFRNEISKPLALAIGIFQFAVLAVNAVSRQIVQNVEIGAYYDVTSEQVNIQWSPMILFLLLFVVGVGVVIWMLRKAVTEARQTIS